MNDERLAELLASIGADLDVTPRRPQLRWTRLAAVAAVIAVVVATVAAVGPARRTVSGWWRAGRVELRAETDLATVREQMPSFVAGNAVAPSEVGRRIGVDAERFGTTHLGPPDAWLAPPEGGALGVWRDGTTTLWIVAADDQTAAMIEKEASSEQVTRLPDLGDGGLVVEGPHVFSTPLRIGVADTTVVWDDAGLALRLESDLPADDAVALAESLGDAFADVGQT